MACVFEETEGKQQAKSSSFEGTKGDGGGQEKGRKGRENGVGE